MISPPIDIQGLSSVDRVNRFADCLHLGAIDLAICRKMTEAIERARADGSNEAVDFNVYVYMALHGCAEFFQRAVTPEDFAKAIEDDEMWRGVKTIRLLKDPSLVDMVAEHMGNAIGLVVYCFGRFTKKRAASERTILESIASEPEARDKAVQFIASLKKGPPYWTERD